MSWSLLREAWVPGLTPDGAVRWIAPLDIPRLGAEIVDVEWGRPEFRIATYELLIGLFAVALADHLRESGDWENLFDGAPDDLAARLDKLGPWFELDGEGPRFQQDLETLEGETRRPDALLIDAPGDNTLKNGADVFSKRDRFPALSRKAAAVALYAMQAFAPTGGAGHRTSMRGGGPLTTLVVPDPPTLWRRIVANLPRLGRGEKALPAKPDYGIVFPWAKPTRVSTQDRKTEQGKDAHFLQHYFGMPRRIRLVFAENVAAQPCAITGEVDARIVTGFVTAPWGVSYGVWRHPLSPYYRVKSGEAPLPIHAQSGRVGYREWSAYLFRRGEEDMRAEQVGAFAETFPQQRGARLLAAGFVTDNMKCLDWAEGEAPLFNLPNQYAREALAAFAHDRLVAAAGIVASALRGALRDALDVDDGQKTGIAVAVERLWIDTEADFFGLIADAQTQLATFAPDAARDVVETFELEDLCARWRSSLARVARRIFRRTAPLDQLGDLDQASVKGVIDGARNLDRCMSGYGKLGAQLFEALRLPLPDRSDTNRAAAASQGAQT